MCRFIEREREIESVLCLLDKGGVGNRLEYKSSVPADTRHRRMVHADRGGFTDDQYVRVCSAANRGHALQGTHILLIRGPGGSALVAVLDIVGTDDRRRSGILFKIELGLVEMFNCKGAAEL